ncbi:MAG: tetratricopeptide repeat protein [Reyranella sp.]|uniref:tetratricopeptide repeat protein n=1 Tax=Reyranella sp. TaxID=1929291 RepID=UPI003D12ED9E
MMVRAALFAALLAASGAAQAQDNSDVAPQLRSAVAAYRNGDLATAEAALRPMVSGSADAEAWLGAVLLERGADREALRLIQRAADAGSPEGVHRLALIHAQGLAGTTRNDGRAYELFLRAASAGHARAQLNLGILFLRGQGVARDLVQARAWLEKAAAGGDPLALYALGRAMDEGSDQVPADPVRAADLFRRAAEKGHMLAALRYGLALSEGTGLKRDPVTAQRWLILAQDNGVPEAALALGDMAARTPASRDKAVNEKIVQSALSWYQVAAHGGVPSAQFKLANAYFAGVGVARDPAQAQMWYTRAAQQGLPQAQHALGLMLIGGVAGQSDPFEGYKWLVLAERGGHPDSRPAREKAGEQIGERERKRAEMLAQSFKPILERPIDAAPPRLVPPRAVPGR